LLRDKGLRGSYTEEIREKGERRGFRLVSFEGTRHIIAHVDFPKSHRVGKYGVDVEMLDSAAALLRPDAKAHTYLDETHATFESAGKAANGFRSAGRS
jgi:nucleoside-triphosphatase THEP1